MRVMCISVAFRLIDHGKWRNYMIDILLSNIIILSKKYFKLVSWPYTLSQWFASCFNPLAEQPKQC